MDKLFGQTCMSLLVIMARVTIMCQQVQADKLSKVIFSLII